MLNLTGKCILFLLILDSCISKNVGIIETEITDKKKEILTEIVLHVDNLNSCKPGFKYFSESESIGINSIILDDSVCFLLDPFHHNIKKVDLTLGEVKCSDPSNVQFRPFSFIVSSEMIYVLTLSSVNYIFNKNLELVGKFELPTGRKYFIGFESSDIVVYSQLFREILIFNKHGEIKNRKSGIFDFQGFCNGKRFEIVENVKYSILKNEFGDFDLDRKLPNTWNYYDSFNIDFDKKNIVYFSSNPDSLVIFVNPIVEK